MGEAVIITFKNWEKHQNAEIKKAVQPFWFKFNNGFFLDSKVFSLDSEEIVTLLYLLCEASRAHKNGSLQIIREHYRMFTRLSDRVLNRTIKKLKQLRIVDIRRSTGSWASVDEESSQNRIERIKENRIEEIHVEPELAFGPQSLLELWNAKCGNLRKANKLTASRKNSAKARLSERPEQMYWDEVIEKMAASSFCSGGGSAGWVADFDFLLKPDTHIKAMEGKFDNSIKKTNPNEATPSIVARYLRGEV